MNSGLAEKYALGAGLPGQVAKKFVHDNKIKFEPMPPESQKKLFSDVVYPAYLTKTRTAYIRAAAKNKEATPWSNLDSKVVEIAVDLTYQQGSIYIIQMQAILKNSRSALADVIKSDPRTSKYEAGRGRAKYLQNN